MIKSVSWGLVIPELCQYHNTFTSCVTLACDEGQLCLKHPQILAGLDKQLLFLDSCEVQS